MITEVQQYLTNKKVSWEFIIEKAPWWGGDCLRKNLGRTSLTFEELRTLLVEMEATINNCPITSIYDDENALSYTLTPSKLIYGRQLVNFVNGRQFELSSTHSTLSKRANHHIHMLGQFAKQWSKEYLLGLQEYHLKFKVRKNTQKVLSNSDVVLMKKDSTACCRWRPAEVRELKPSRDGTVRAAKIQVLCTDKRIVMLRRPIQLLIPLEVSQDS